MVLPASLHDSDQLLAVAEELHHLAVKLGQARRHGPKAATEELSPPAVAALDLVPEASRADDAAIERLRVQLEHMATAAPVVTLVLAGAASSRLKQELVGWLRQNVHAGLLVNFRVNPDIAGGVVIRTTNHVYDCSFRRPLLANAHKFTEVLERVR
jgi:F0F1-type ATP synthase delta subunit